MTTTRGLLQALGLPDKPVAKAGAGNKTTLDDAALAKALKEMPADPVKRADALAELARQVGDKARRDPIVKALRDLVVKIQPVMPDADARKAIDQAIDDAVEKGAKAALMALLKAVVGKGPSAVDRDGPRQDGPNMPEKDLGEHIYKLPELPLPFDKPPKVRRNSFELIGLQPSYKASKYFDFKVRTPDWLDLSGHTGASWVVVSTQEDFDKNGGRPRVRDRRIDAKGELSMSLAAPDEPGKYVLFIVVGPGNEDRPTHTFDVK